VSSDLDKMLEAIAAFKAAKRAAKSAPRPVSATLGQPQEPDTTPAPPPRGSTALDDEGRRRRGQIYHDGRCEMLSGHEDTVRCDLKFNHEGGHAFSTDRGTPCKT
jgi:hypothetical protein